MAKVTKKDKTNLDDNNAMSAANDETAGVGHNNPPEEIVDPFEEQAATTQDRLKNYVRRAEAINEQKDALNEDYKDLFAEIKASGLSVAPIKKIITIRRKKQEVYQEELELLRLYASVFGIDA